MGWLSGPCEPDDHEEMLIIERSEPTGEDDDEGFGESLLRQIAEDPESTLIELSEGVYYQPKLRPDRDELS